MTIVTAAGRTIRTPEEVAPDLDYQWCDFEAAGLQLDEAQIRTVLAMVVWADEGPLPATPSWLAGSFGSPIVVIRDDGLTVIAENGQAVTPVPLVRPDDVDRGLHEHYVLAAAACVALALDAAAAAKPKLPETQPLKRLRG